jgi:CubicO group peptidase (beta-lactamase class C family)
MQQRVIGSAVIVVCLAATLFAQADAVDEFIKREMERQHIPGLSLAVVRDGRVVKSAGYGLADREQHIPATPETVYKVGSVGKQFVATAVMVLVQDGRVGLDDPISTYLLDTPESWHGITIRHLLTHTSGLPREAPGFDWEKARPDVDVVKSAYSLPLHFAPGEKWEYSNAGYFALAAAITSVSGRPWQEFVTEAILKPSGMNTTLPTNTKDELPHRAIGYRNHDQLLVAHDFKTLRPSGGFFSTVLDLAKWDTVLDTNVFLSEASRRQMWTPVKLNDGRSYPYGFGWQLDPLNGHRQVHHSGGIPGFASQFARFPDDHLTVIVLVNLDDDDVQSIAAGVASRYLHAPLSASR